MRSLLFAAALFCVFPAAGQYRAEFISYDIRSESDRELTDGSKYYRALDFVDNGDVWLAVVDIPTLWLDRDVFIREPRFSGRFSLMVNGVGARFEECVTPLLREGENFVEVVGGRPEGIYLFSQPRVRVVDYIVSGHHDEEVKDAVLDLQVILKNGFNMEEKVTVGYDIYDPEGKLKDVVFEDFTIAGQSTDTLRFYNKVVDTRRFQYSAGHPSLHRVTISVRHGGIHSEYIPFRVGFGAADLSDRDADFLTEPATKAEYDRWEREGRLIFDCAAIEGNPNDPGSVDRFVERQRSMYYRNRNRANVVGWSLGQNLGNGYNMYKAYQWMKSVEAVRPVVYIGADGEWNSDL